MHKRKQFHAEDRETETCKGGQRDRDIKSWRERWGQNEEGRDRKRMKKGGEKKTKTNTKTKSVRERWGENKER